MTEATFYVTDGFDDAHEQASGAFDNSGGQVRCCRNTDPDHRYSAGFRFHNVTIPQGATISTCVLHVYVEDIWQDDLHCDIYGHDVDNAPDFNDNQNIESQVQRPRTTATIAWDADALGAGWKSKSGLQSIIQEIVDRAGWSSGNGLVLLLIGEDGTPATDCIFFGYDQSSSYRAYIVVNYEAGWSGKVLGVTNPAKILGVANSSIAKVLGV